MTMRRSSGEGTDIVMGPDGRFHAWLSMGTRSGGRRDRRHVSGRTRAEAASKLRELQGRRDAGVVLEAGRSPTVGQWLGHNVETVAAPKLRQGEALGLRWEDLDLDAGTLTVRRALQRQTGRGLVLVEPKSRAGYRTISLPAQLAEALRTHRAEQAAQRLRAGTEWQDHGLVFAQPTGRPVEPRTDHKAWKRLLTAAGVPAARLHDARHTAATVLLSQGLPARVAMEILGNSQISLTLGTYSHVVPVLQRDAAAAKNGHVLWGCLAPFWHRPP